MSQQKREEAENLRELLRQHWLHCRHLENERTWFLLAYIGSLASILGLVYFRTGAEWAIIIPILLTLLGLLLTKRWSDAFEKHRKCVEGIIGHLGLQVLEVDKDRVVDLTMNIPPGRFFRVFRTRWLFYLFYIVIFVGLIILWVVSLIHPELLR